MPKTVEIVELDPRSQEVTKDPRVTRVIRETVREVK